MFAAWIKKNCKFAAELNITPQMLVKDAISEQFGENQPYAFNKVQLIHHEDGSLELNSSYCEVMPDGDLDVNHVASYLDLPLAQAYEEIKKSLPMSMTVRGTHRETYDVFPDYRGVPEHETMEAGKISFDAEITITGIGPLTPQGRAQFTLDKNAKIVSWE